MRRMIITAIASTALAIPAAAVASHQGEHRAGEVHHGAHHKRHHRHSHVLRFGAVASSGPTSGTTTARSSAPPAETSDQNAGTIASFANGTLTLTLTDGSAASGKVTEGTEIECRSAMASAASDGRSGEQGGRDDSSDDSSHDGRSGSGPSAGGQDDGPGHDVGDDGEQNESGHCTPAALVPGAVVREAELRVSSAGAVWEKVELGQ
jgi:hypothetical protein